MPVEGMTVRDLEAITAGNYNYWYIFMLYYLEIQFALFSLYQLIVDKSFSRVLSY